MKNKTYPLIFLLSFVIVCLFAILYVDRIIAFSVERFTPCRMTYDRWGSSPFNRSEIDGVRIELKNNEFAARAEKSRFRFKPDRLFKDGQLVVDCEMEGVSFYVKAIDEQGSGPGGNVMAIPFGSGQQYESIVFRLFLDKGAFKVLDFSAHSMDIKMKGEYAFFKEREEIYIDLKILFSPELSGTFPDNVRDGILSPDEDGWYGTVINYRGNPVFLKAIYSLTA